MNVVLEKKTVRVARAAASVNKGSLEGHQSSTATSQRPPRRRRPALAPNPLRNLGSTLTRLVCAPFLVYTLSTAKLST